MAIANRYLGYHVAARVGNMWDLSEATNWWLSGVFEESIQRLPDFKRILEHRKNKELRELVQKGLVDEENVKAAELRYEDIVENIDDNRLMILTKKPAEELLQVYQGLKAHYRPDVDELLRCHLRNAIPLALWPNDLLNEDERQPEFRKMQQMHASQMTASPSGGLPNQNLHPGLPASVRDCLLRDKTGPTSGSTGASANSTPMRLTAVGGRFGGRLRRATTTPPVSTAV